MTNSELSDMRNTISIDSSMELKFHCESQPHTLGTLAFGAI